MIHQHPGRATAPSAGCPNAGSRRRGQRDHILPLPRGLAAGATPTALTDGGSRSEIRGGPIAWKKHGVHGISTPRTEEVSARASERGVRIVLEMIEAQGGE